MVAFYLPEESELPTTDLPQAIVPIASSVRVEAGATIGVDLRVNKWPWSQAAK